LSSIELRCSKLFAAADSNGGAEGGSFDKYKLFYILKNLKIIERYTNKNNPGRMNGTNELEDPKF
jgi:hypothetical protein